MNRKTIAFETIRVAERGTSELTSEAWAQLERSASFWALVERGVVSVEHARHERVKLSGGPYVGRSLVGENILLEVHEKVKGSLSALLGFASGSDFRVERSQSPSTDMGGLMTLLAAHFVDATRQYAARGRQFRYVARSMRGSLVGGRLNVPKTLQLHARGLRHLAAFEKNSVSYDIPLNRLVLAALREVDRIRTVIDLPPEVVARTRSMAMVFDDCRGPEVLYGIKGQMADEAERLSETESDRTAADLMGLASVILSNESFEQAAPQRGIAPRAWFLNLETLFERAVRETMRRALRSVATVSSGKAKPAAIFSGYEGLSANPDLVVRPVEGAICIGDVKYKRWGGAPKAADMYQLLVHAAAFKASQAFLVYPSESFGVTSFGTAATGASARVYTLEIDALPDQVRRMLTDFSLSFSAKEPQVAHHDLVRTAHLGGSLTSGT